MLLMIFASHHLSRRCSPSFRLQSLLKLINLAQPLGVPGLQTGLGGLQPLSRLQINRRGWHRGAVLAALPACSWPHGPHCGAAPPEIKEKTNPKGATQQTQAGPRSSYWQRAAPIQRGSALALSFMFSPQSSHQIIINIINKRRGQVIKCKICGVLLELAA